MYCINCGVKLADTENVCPLCATRVFHPDMERQKGTMLYPENRYPSARRHSLLPAAILTAIALLPVALVLICDWQLSGKLDWSAYVVGALLLAYVLGVLPLWFAHPNPVIFVPCGFVAVGAYLWFINELSGGDWFLSFAFPITGALCLIVTAVVTLCRYLPRGRLYIFGGAMMLLGGMMLLIEFLMYITFSMAFVGWSLYPLTVFVLSGALLIFLAICRPARQTMERKFFI